MSHAETMQRSPVPGPSSATDLGGDLARVLGRVVIDDVSIVYGNRRGSGSIALQPTSITLAPSSFTALIGPSGCGKSTLLNAVAGFVKAFDRRHHD